MAEVKAVIFDLNNTLVKSGDPEGRIIKEFGLALPYWKVESVFCGRTRSSSNGEFSKEVAGKLGIPLTEKNLAKLEGIVEAELKIVRPFADAIPTLKALKAKGLKLGLVSNSWAPAIEKIRKESRLLDLFDAISFSHKTGKFKPNPASFKNCTRALGIKPFEAVMVGDSVRNDVGGAARVKMRGILLNRSPARVENLGSVPQVFGLKAVGKAIEVVKSQRPIQVGQPRARKPEQGKSRFGQSKTRFGQQGQQRKRRRF